MNKLEAARARLKETENSLARLQGEENILQEQLDAAIKSLTELGISENEAEEHLLQLRAEEQRLNTELKDLDDKAMTKLSNRQ